MFKGPLSEVSVANQDDLLINETYQFKLYASLTFLNVLYASPFSSPQLPFCFEQNPVLLIMFAGDISAFPSLTFGVAGEHQNLSCMSPRSDSYFKFGRTAVETTDRPTGFSPQEIFGLHFFAELVTLKNLWKWIPAKIHRIGRHIFLRIRWSSNSWMDILGWKWQIHLAHPMTSFTNKNRENPLKLMMINDD